MRQIQDRLGKTRGLNNTPNFDGAFLLNQFPDNSQELWGELHNHRD